MKISIITATHNSGSTLRDAMESILRQSLKDIEYIVVDGASKDDTIDVIKEYEPRFGGRMRWISESDEGLYEAMNKGISMATGDVIGILNSDDFFSSDNILEQVSATLKDENLDAVFGDVHYVSNLNLSKSVRYYSSKYFHRWQMCLGFMPAHPSFYCRRSVYQEYGAFNTSYLIHADFELLLRFIFIHRIRIKYLALDFVTMRTGGASAFNFTNYKRRVQEHLLAYRENNVHSNIIFDNLRFPVKFFAIVSFRLKTFFRFQYIFRPIKRKDT